MSDSGEAKTPKELESQRESSDKSRLDEDSEKVARTEDDDDALPLACPICKTPFLDPVVTNCDHYFCNLCALKHHEKDTNCFVCKNPTLGVFKIKNTIAKVRENAKLQLESQAAEEDSQSQQKEVAESSNKRKLDEDSEQVARAEDDDDALPLACPFCKLPFLDPVVTTCDHYFCNLCALKHHKNDATCFVCKNPTLGVFKPSVEIKNKIAKVRENMKPQENKAAMFDFEEYTSQYIGSYYQGRPLLLRVLHMVTHKLLDEEDNLQALQFLFDRLKPGKYIYKTNPEFLQLVSDQIGGRKGDEYIASQKMLQDMRKEYNEIRDSAFSSPPFRKVEDMERNAHVLGRFLYANGHVREAYKELSKVQNTILFMVVALEAREFEVLCSLPAVESLRGVSCNEELTMQEECIRALGHLGKGDYYTAACKFQKVMKMYSLAELWKRCPFELLTLDDTHMFCTWTAMATMTRREIEKVASVMGKKRANHSYRYLLSQYIARNYSECVRFLHEQLKSKARKDMYLFDHVDRLFHLITERCIREAEKFSRDVDKLLALITEEELGSAM